jgi:hypothetical protein
MSSAILLAALARPAASLLGARSLALGGLLLLRLART